MKRGWKLFGCVAVVCLAVAVHAQELKFAPIGDLKLASGEVLKDCRVSYRTYGALNADKSNAVLFPTWFAGTSADLGKYSIGAGKVVDPARYFVIAVDALGDGVSSSPSNNSAQGGPKFPKITMRDMVESQHQLVTKTLGLSHLHAVVGVSMGGMQTFQWAVQYPDFMDLSIPIVGSPQLTTYDLMLLNTDLEIINHDPDFNGGLYDVNPPLKALARIHQLFLMTPQFHVAHTSRAELNKFLADERWTMDANDTLRQLEAIMGHDVAAQFDGSMERAAAAVKASMLIVVASQDHIVNPTPALKFAELVKAPVLKLEGDCGHLATGCEGEKLRTAVADFLASEGR